MSLPTPLPVSAIASSGGVQSATIAASGCWHIPNGGGAANFPAIALAAPPSGGTQATAQISSLHLVCPVATGYLASGGTGYAVNDILTLAGATCTTKPQVKVTTVSSGVVTAVTGYNAGTACTSLPAEPAGWTGGSGSGFQSTNLGWSAGVSGGDTVAVTAAGSGYITPPGGSVSATSTATLQSGGSTGSVSTTVTGSFTATAAAGQIVLNSSGTSLGVNGPSGGPVLSLGASIDASGVRQSLGATYTVPANTSLVRFTQGSTVSASTVTLPTALADGQPVQFVNYAGAVTALTFSPAANGWTNGSTLAAYTGLRVRWDATAGAWYREQ